MYLITKLINVLPNRIVSAAIDLITLVLAASIFSVVEELVFTTQETSKNNVYIAIILFSVFLNKDIYLGQSIGKCFIGSRVVSIKTGNAASPIQCSIRNLFLLIWPLEAIILLISPKRRIGDIVARTEVQESIEIGNKMKWQYVQAILSMVASVILCYYLFTFIDSLGIIN